MTLVQVQSLVGKNISGTKADVRSRNADGSLMYEHNTEPQMVTMKAVRYRKDRDETWLRWEWDGRPHAQPLACGFSGICIQGKYCDPVHAAEYHILMEVTA